MSSRRVFSRIPCSKAAAHQCLYAKCIVNMDEKPNAVFIVVPDERFTRHRFVTLFITQMYKELVEKANLNSRRGQTETAILKRNTYFVLDEFGNLPKFENMEGMVTVARSRGIRFLFVLQSLSQLTAKYGREIGDIVKTNCNVKIFIGSDDPETRREFSELCGQKKIKSYSVSTSAETSASSNTGAANQPLITVGMLERLNGEEKGDAIVSVRGYEPIWTRFTPSYELKKIYFQAENTVAEERSAKLFEKEEYVFDITGGKAESEQDKILAALEKRETKQASVNDKDRLASLDEQWLELESGVRDRLKKILPILDEDDAAAVQKAALENKVMLLYEIAGRYEESVKQRIEDAAAAIDGMLKDMIKLQEAAIEKQAA